MLESEKSRSDELGKTLENMRHNIEKLETEKLRKDALVEEYTALKKQLDHEQDTHRGLEMKIVQLEKSKKLTEERCASAEKVLQTLTADSYHENKENNDKFSLSKQEIETALQRPASRRQGLSSLDNNVSNNRSSLPVQLTPGHEQCCGHLKQLETVTIERDAALAKLKSTRSSLATAADKLSQSNRRKKQMEKEICHELSKTHQVLRKTKTNLENCGGAQ